MILRKQFGRMVVALLMSYPFLGQSVEMQFTGRLLQDACTIKAGDEKLEVALDVVSDKDLYVNLRGATTSFQIQLEGCDTSVAEMLKIRFAGVESAELPGYIFVGDVSGSKGYAVGIEAPSGMQLKINDENSAHEQELIDGDNTILLRAFLQAEPFAVDTKKIIPGSYSTSVTFILEYS